MTLLAAEKRIRHVYDPAGWPASWRDVDVAWLKDAVFRYREGLPLSDVHVDRLIDYADYYIAAPVWTRPDNENERWLRMAPKLRDAIKYVDTLDDLESWRKAAQVAGLDPFEEIFGGSA